MRVLLVATLLLVPTVAPAAARKGCSDASYVVEDAPIVPGDDSLRHNGITIAAGKLGVGGSCAPVKVVRQVSKHGTRVSAQWRRCTGVVGKARFKGVIDATCTTLTGRLTARRAKLARAIVATAVGSGPLHGQLRVAQRTAVPEAARATVLEQRAQYEALGKEIADDGSTIGDPLAGIGGWLVVVGDVRTRTDPTGAFTIEMPPAGATEGEIYRPADESAPVAAFWLVPHLVPDGATPVPIDLAVINGGACGMNDDATTDPPSCHAAADTAAAHVAPIDLHPDPQVTLEFDFGALGTYPHLNQTVCADQDGSDADGTTISGTLRNYIASTCDLRISQGCCGDELGLDVVVIVKTAVGKLTGFKPISCGKNHKGRYCQAVRQFDVAVQVPAGVASAEELMHLPDSVGQLVSPGSQTPVTVHNNACYGETHVTKTEDTLGGTLTGPAFDGSTLKHYDVPRPNGFTYQTDRSLTYLAPSCPPNQTVDKWDRYSFEADGKSVSVGFRMICVATTTTTSTTSSTLAGGRAVTLTYTTGSFSSSTQVCLSRITGGCVTPAHPPMCSYTHLHTTNGFGIGIDGGGPYQDPHISMGDPCGYGQVTTVPGCGPDSVPDCG
jgi:hypothetical protein